MHIYSHSELSCERASKSYIAFPKASDDISRKQLKRKMKPGQPLCPAQADSAAALSGSHGRGSPNLDFPGN